MAEDTETQLIEKTKKSKLFALQLDKSTDITGQQISKIFFCICDEYVIHLFVCIYEVRKGT